MSTVSDIAIHLAELSGVGAASFFASMVAGKKTNTTSSNSVAQAASVGAQNALNGTADAVRRTEQAVSSLTQDLADHRKNTQVEFAEIRGAAKDVRDRTIRMEGAMDERAVALKQLNDGVLGALAETRRLRDHDTANKAQIATNMRAIRALKPKAKPKRSAT